MDFAFAVVVVYVCFLNLFVLRTTPEVIVLQFAILIVIFKKLRFKEFAKFWIPFIGLFFTYEFLRGFADDISPFYDTTLYWMYELEMKLFGGLPTRYLQQTFSGNSSLLNFSAFFYSVFFYYSFFAAFVLWLKKSPVIVSYAKRFIALSFVGLVFFFLIPTAPPWMVDLERGTGIDRFLHTENTILHNFLGLSLWKYLIYGNAVAALPSLHVAWPAFTTHFLIRNFQGKWLYLLLIIPAMIGFSVVLTGEHYIVDVMFGWGLALVMIYFPKNRLDRLRSSLRELNHGK